MSEQIKVAPTLEMLRARRDEILAIAEQHGVSNVRVFGSVARGEATSESDIDFLADFPSHYSLLKLSGLVRALKILLGYPINVASAEYLREEIRPMILRDVKPL